MIEEMSKSSGEGSRGSFPPVGGDSESTASDATPPWLRGAPQEVVQTFEDMDIDEKAAKVLTEDDVREMIRNSGLDMSLGAKKRLWAQVVRYQHAARRRARGGSVSRLRAMSRASADSGSEAMSAPSSSLLGTGEITEALAAGLTDIDPIPNIWEIRDPRDLSRYCKLLIATLYFGLSIVATAITMVFVHERVPDQSTYPPLPDLMLDNIPLIPGAFAVAETLGLVLLAVFWAIVAVHKHRVIILRRAFAISGSIFLMRCCTMVATSLSVPGRHLECAPQVYPTLADKLQRAGQILSGGGMSVAGVATCGDYMFSGHTVAITQLNFLISEYTPRSMRGLHIMAWVINLFGIFFILAAHEHYSIDVLVAAYITSRLHTNYHALVRVNALQSGSGTKLIHAWFPMFSYLEQSCPPVVPNEYEVPPILCWIFCGTRYCRRGGKDKHKHEHHSTPSKRHGDRRNARSSPSRALAFNSPAPGSDGSSDDGRPTPQVSTGSSAASPSSGLQAAPANTPPRPSPTSASPKTRRKASLRSRKRRD